MSHRPSSAAGETVAPEPSGSEADRADQAQAVQDAAGEAVVTPDPERVVVIEDDE